MNAQNFPYYHHPVLCKDLRPSIPKTPPNITRIEHFPHQGPRRSEYEMMTAIIAMYTCASITFTEFTPPTLLDNTIMTAVCTHNSYGSHIDH